MKALLEVMGSKRLMRSFKECQGTRVSPTSASGRLIKEGPGLPLRYSQARMGIQKQFFPQGITRELDMCRSPVVGHWDSGEMTRRKRTV